MKLDNSKSGTTSTSTSSFARSATDSIDQASAQAEFAMKLSKKLADYDTAVTANQKVNQLFDKI